ncbi:MAG: efflux RND transporter periplasmic adaptor subunit [Bryobacteraceae bacterium]
MKKLLLYLLLVLAACAVAIAILHKGAPPPVKFTRVKRQTLISSVPTNGKVEPYRWQAVRAEAAGLVSRVPVQNGSRVAEGALLAELTDPEVQTSIDSASARVSEAQANLQLLQSGGKPADLSEIENSLGRAHFDLDTEQRELDAVKRLVAKQAATPMEERAAADKVRATQIEIAGLEKRRNTQVAKPDVEAAQARLDAAQAALRLAKQRSALTVVRAPIAGEIYELSVRPGAYVNVGDLVANIGTLDRLRVRVYVDEPLLGRVKLGEPVAIRWEALPGRTWNGAVDQMPASIQTLGSRQVGEVVCAIENPGRDLIPGNNVDAEIRTAVVGNTLVIPKETMRRDAAGDYVFLLQDGAIERRAIKTGISNVTQAQVVEGLAEGDDIALPSDLELKAGERVQADVVR